jgi:hypothetical protein
MILYPLLHLWDMISTMIWYDFIFVDIISTITLWYNSGHNNPWRIHVAAIYYMLTWLGYIDGNHGTPYIAAPWILWVIRWYDIILQYMIW